LAVEGDAFPADAVEVGRVLGAWGIKGWIKVQPFASDPQALFSTKRWYLRPPEGPGAEPPPLLRVMESREQGGFVVAGAAVLGLIAAVLPARNAARLDPAQAIRG